VVERFAPPLTDVDTGAEIVVEEDLVGQTRILFAQPLFERNRFAIVGAGVTQE
jgi:hypothetical protein